jgi:hypothetical protein
MRSLRELITVVIPVSPIPSHPNIDILAQTVASVRVHLPDSEIMLTFDGVRPEQEQWRKRYEAATHDSLVLADTVWHPVVPTIFDSHNHQTGMLRNILDDIRTPLLLYVEQDTPIVGPSDHEGRAIEWEILCGAILDGTSNTIRLYHEAVMPAEHQHLMHGREGRLPLLRTSQWSQRPHLSSVAYQRRMLGTHFTKTAKSFIEDKMYGVVTEAYNVDGVAGWLQHRLHIYAPDSQSWKRSLNLDGRDGGDKYDDTQQF